MGRLRKTNSNTLKLAKARLAGLTSIEPTLDLGGNKSIATYKEKIEDYETKMSNYNQLLAKLDGVYNSLLASEQELAAYNTEMLAAIKGIYGRDSNEYEKSGGTRYSERKRRKIL